MSLFKMNTAYHNKLKDENKSSKEEEVPDEDSEEWQKQYSRSLRNHRHNNKGDQEKQQMVKVPSILSQMPGYLPEEEYNSNMKMLKQKRDQLFIFLESVGLNKKFFEQDFERTIDGLINTCPDNIIQKEVASFLDQRLNLYANSNSFSHKNIVIQKPLQKFHPLSPAVPRRLNFIASDKNSPNIISNIVAIEGGIVSYSPHLMTLFCSTIDGGYNVVHSLSPVTDLTRVDKQTVMATIPFKKKIIFINPSSFQVKTFQHDFYKISYVKESTFAGIEFFSKTIYLADWLHNTVESIFSLKDDPTNIAVGTNDSLLITFANINRIICYNLKGQQLFQFYSHSLTVPTDLTVYDNDFYILQGNIIYKVSSTGRVSQREIGIKARYFFVSVEYIFFSDYLGVGHVVRKNKDFWPRLTYPQQEQTPVLNKQIYIDDSDHIKKILPMTSSSVLVTYWHLKAILITDDGTKLWKKPFTFQFQPTDFCRVDSSSFLVLFKENKKIQYITCPVDSPVLKQGPLIAVHAHYIQMCHIVANKFLALTTEENKEVHILLVKEDGVVIEKRLSLEHHYVSVAATPITFVVVIQKEYKLIFYSIDCKKLFERYLDFNGYPHHIYSNNIYFYVICSRESTVICYDIYGEVKWQLKLPTATASTIGIVKGTICVVDSNLHRILFYNHREWSNCRLRTRSPYIRNLNIRYSAAGENQKILISQIYQLPNKQLVVSDINSDCLLYITKKGQVVHTVSLPSLATDICRWDSSQIGVTLPLEKELWVIGNLSKRVRIVSLNHSYVKACKLNEDQIVCFCDKPYHLDIVSLKKHNQGEVISSVDIPFLIKSLATEDESLNLLIVAKKNIFVYNTSSEMRSSPLHSTFKAHHSLYGGCIDKKSIYLIDERRMFAINDHNLVVKDYVTNNQLKMSLDLIDVFSRKICISEMLTSALYLEDLTVSDEAEEFLVPLCLRDEKPVAADCSVITENNLIAVFDRNNNTIKLLTFDGQLLDSVRLDVPLHHMCRWKSNTLAITTETNKLLTLKIDFPLSFSTYRTKTRFNCIASLSNNLLVCDHGIERFEKYTLSVIQINERQSAIHIKKNIDLTAIKCSNDFSHVTVIGNDIIVVCGDAFTYFLNSDGECLYSFNHLFPYNCMTNDGIYVYIPTWNATRLRTRIVCLSQTGEYKKIFLNKKRSAHKFYFNSIDCNGPRFSGNNETSLYVEGLFKLNRERFYVCRIQTDLCSVQIKDIDISVDAKTVVIEKSNPGNVKMFQRNGRMICHANLGTTLGGVCFSEKYHIMVTAPDREEIFQLNQNLTMRKIWQSLVPYGVIWRKMKNIYVCVHINLTEYHTMQIDGDKLRVLESVSLLKSSSSLYFTSTKVQMDNKIFSDEKNKELENGESRGKSEEIICNGRLKVRCGNYMAYSISGSDEVIVRSLPHRTTMFSLPLTAFGEEGYKMYKYIKPIKLQNNTVVFLFKNTLTVTTRDGHVIQQSKINKIAQDICCWTSECFVVVIYEEKQLMFFNKDLSLLKTINTEENYNLIYKKNENQLVCAYDGKLRGNRSYVDVLNINGDKYEYSQKIIIGDKMISAIGVTSSEDIIVIKDEKVQCVVSWHRAGDLIRSLPLPSLKLPFHGISERPLAIYGENVFIADLNKDIYQVSLYSECQTLLSSDDIEVHFVMALFVSHSSLLIIGALEDNTCCFFNYER